MRMGNMAFRMNGALTVLGFVLLSAWPSVRGDDNNPCAGRHAGRCLVNVTLAIGLPDPVPSGSIIGIGPGRNITELVSCVTRKQCHTVHTDKCGKKDCVNKDCAIDIQPTTGKYDDNYYIITCKCPGPTIDPPPANPCNCPDYAAVHPCDCGARRKNKNVLASATCDPHFVGFDGRGFDFQGAGATPTKSGRTYVMIYDPSSSFWMTAHFSEPPLTGKFPHSTYISDIGIMLTNVDASNNNTNSTFLVAEHRGKLPGAISRFSRDGGLFHYPWPPVFKFASASESKYFQSIRNESAHHDDAHISYPMDIGNGIAAKLSYTATGAELTLSAPSMDLELIITYDEYFLDFAFKSIRLSKSATGILGRTVPRLSKVTTPTRKQFEQTLRKTADTYEVQGLFDMESFKHRTSNVDMQRRLLAAVSPVQSAVYSNVQDIV